MDRIERSSSRSDNPLATIACSFLIASTTCALPGQGKSFVRSQRDVALKVPDEISVTRLMLLYTERALVGLSRFVAYQRLTSDTGCKRIHPSHILLVQQTMDRRLCICLSEGSIFQKLSQDYEARAIY